VQALIEFIIKNLMAFWPVARVYTWQQGLRVRCGKVREELEPGLHLRVPFIDEINKTTRSDMTVDLPTGSVVTEDGVSVVYSANVCYKVTSIRAGWVKIYRFDDSVVNMAFGALATAVASRTWQELKRDRKALETALVAELNEAMDGWGLQVLRVFLTDLVPARQFRMYGDTPGQNAKRNF
jgi:regulator of protease activity HflC (stomatin/prohibitin superfamily)